MNAAALSGHHRHQSHGLAAGLARPRLAGVLQAFHALLVGDRAHAFAARFAEVEASRPSDGERYRSEARVPVPR